MKLVNCSGKVRNLVGKFSRLYCSKNIVFPIQEILAVLLLLMSANACSLVQITNLDYFKFYRKLISKKHCLKFAILGLYNFSRTLILTQKWSRKFIFVHTESIF